VSGDAVTDDVVVDLSVNGEPVRRLVPASRTLLELLRVDLGLTGSKHGCDVGDCGACTVLVDGVARLSCITLAADVQGPVRTIEGVAPDDPIVLAFERHQGSQCGYCTPGFVMNLVGVRQSADPTDEDALRTALGANICRCTGYTKILAAARDALGSR
jgi:aerobic-type carbon monoxide dehydrogenase small subunit (CoxS/CutS family)